MEKEKIENAKLYCNDCGFLMGSRYLKTGKLIAWCTECQTQYTVILRRKKA